MENKYYVYEWIRLDTNEPFYVGKGSNDRWRELKRQRNKWFIHIVEKIPVAVNILHDNLDEQTAFEYEIWYIREYRDIMGYNLCNIQDGGEGHSLPGELNPMYGKTHSENAKRKMSEKAMNRILSEEQKTEISKRTRGKNNPMYGKTHSEDARVKMSESQKKRKRTKEEGEKRSKTLKENGHWKGENNPGYGKHGKFNPRSKSVICITVKTIFYSVQDASVFYRTGRANISKCCKGNKNYAYAGKLPDGTKLVWRYLVWKHDKKYRVKGGDALV